MSILCCWNLSSVWGIYFPIWALLDKLIMRTVTRTLTVLYCRIQSSIVKVKGKRKGRVLAIALLTRELVTRSALQSRKWQLIGMS